MNDETVLLRLGFLHQFVERIADAVVRRDDADFAAPDQERADCVDHIPHVAVECRLVDDDGALKATNVFRSRGKRLNAEAGGKADDVAGNRLAGAVLALVEEDAVLDRQHFL
ncbi:hypothetical protein D3C71_1895300 [compost metagenome]